MTEALLLLQINQFIEVCFQRFAELRVTLTMKKHIVSCSDNIFSFGAFGNGIDMEVFIHSTGLRTAVIQVYSPDS